jgi:hypothetical protein
MTHTEPPLPSGLPIQGTTAKLSQLLAKRSATGLPDLPAHESELASLRRAVAMLRQELAACRQQMGPGISIPAGASVPIRPDLSRPSAENAPPRLHDPLRTETAAAAEAPPPAQAGAGSVIPAGEGACADATSANSLPPTGGSSAYPPIGMIRSVSATLRTPHGYVEGAICVEFPRRQRVRTSSSAMPRSSSTVGTSRPLPGIPLARSPTAPAATLQPGAAQKTDGQA